MVTLGTYVFKILNTRKITPRKYFTNAYSKEVYKSEHVCTSTQRLRVILYAEYKKADLYMVMENQCQHLTMAQCNELLKLLQKVEELFDGTLGTWKVDLVDLELK